MRGFGPQCLFCNGICIVPFVFCEVFFLKKTNKQTAEKFGVVFLAFASGMDITAFVYNMKLSSNHVSEV